MKPPGFYSGLHGSPHEDTDRTGLEGAKRNKSGSVETDVSIAGAWKADSIGFEYEITQTGKTFTWQVTNRPDLEETGEGEFIGKNRISATWKNNRYSGSGEGGVITEQKRILPDTRFLPC